MYKTISNEIIRQFQPCYDPSDVIKDENEELPIKDWVQKYRNVVPAKDIVWLLLKDEFLSEKDLRLFSVWCAREALKLVENPDERSIEACDVAERYANGEATKEDLLVARHAADHAADAAYVAYATDADYNVVYHAYYAAYYATRATSYAAYAAYGASYEASIAAYIAYATRNGDNAAVYDAIRSAQLEQLLIYFE
jgi:hypothetical protein